MFRFLKDAFVPSASNDYEPHVLRAWPVAILLIVIVTFFGTTQFIRLSLENSDSFLAAVVAPVLVDLTNFDRASEGLHSLSVNSVLQDAAQQKADDMAAKGYFSHNSPDGKTPWYWFQQAGYKFSYAGENLAVFFGDSKDVEQAWLNSPSHRANILNSHFTEIGIATAEGYYQGQKTTFVVQLFGTPSVTAPIATVAASPVTNDTPTQSVTEGTVSGESVAVITEENSAPVSSENNSLSVVHQDDTFIAVKNDNAVSAPSATSPEIQSNFFERLVASPSTLLSYVYTVLAAIVALALILLIVLEVRIQKPKNIAFAFLLLAVLSTLFYFSYSSVVVASTDAFVHTTSLFS